MMYEWYKHLKLINEIIYQGIALGGYFVNQMEVKECLLLCGANSFVFQFAVQKYKSIQNYNFVCCIVWGWNFVAHFEEGA
jgi:hypothetical protein